MNQHILPLKHPNLSTSLGVSLPDLPQKSPQNLPLENILPFVVERPKGHQKIGNKEFNLQASHEKRAPGCLGDQNGSKTTQLYRDYNKPVVILQVVG